MVRCELCEERLHTSCEGFKTDERSCSHATNTISAWNFLMVESGKDIFSLIFLKNGAVNEFYGAIDISFQMRGGTVSRHPRYGKAEVITHGNLKVNKHATCDLKISSPVTVSLLGTVR